MPTVRNPDSDGALFHAHKECSMKKKTEKCKSQFTLEEAEKLAGKLEREFAPICTKLRSLKPEVEKMQAMFKELCKGSVTIAGCRNFGEFCEKKLGRKRQTVYEMLGDYKKSRKENGNANESEGDDANAPVQRGNRDKLKQELAEAKANVERLLPVGQAAGKFVEALQSGDEAKKEEAIKELQFTIEATPQTGLNANDQPNIALMHHELLVEIQRVGDRIYAAAPTLVKLANAQIKRLSLHGKIGFVQSEPGAAATVAVIMKKQQMHSAQAA
jgi:hypothetical protein